MGDFLVRYIRFYFNKIRYIKDVGLEVNLSLTVKTNAKIFYRSVLENVISLTVNCTPIKQERLWLSPSVATVALLDELDEVDKMKAHERTIM